MYSHHLTYVVINWMLIHQLLININILFTDIAHVLSCHHFILFNNWSKWKDYNSLFFWLSSIPTHPPFSTFPVFTVCSRICPSQPHVMMLGLCGCHDTPCTKSVWLWLESLHGNGRKGAIIIIHKHSICVINQEQIQSMKKGSANKCLSTTALIFKALPLNPPLSTVGHLKYTSCIYMYMYTAGMMHQTLLVA